MNTERDLQLLFELGTLRFIQRAWKQMLGPNVANLAEHHFRVTWIALVLAKMEGKGDLGKIALMSSLHDVAEGRTGDAHYMSQLYTKRDEESAFKDIFADTSLSGPMNELWEEYEKHESLESKIVKDADWLDVDFELREQAANGNTMEQEYHLQRNESIYPRFHTESARKLYKKLEAAHPHDWFVKGKNRFTKGDLPKINQD